MSIVLQNWRKLTFLIAAGLCVASTPEVSQAAIPPDGIEIYQKNVHLSSTHKKQLADDIARYEHADNLWDALREEFSLPHYEDNPQVQERIEWFLDNQDYLLRAATRAAPYLYYILQQVKKRHLPAELALLPIIESGYNPFSYSNMGASGIWQLMPDTATNFGVRQDFWYDGRRDVIASTRAALNYLSYLQSFFEGNWLLAIAAYNTGEGNVLTAMRRNLHYGRRTDFWSLPLSQETRGYVPSLLALATIISRPNDFPLYFPPVKNAPYLAQVDIGSQINLKIAAALAGISYPRLMQLNPGYNRTMISRGPYKIILPIENVEQFTENLSRTPLNHELNLIHYKVKNGDTFVKIAKKFNVSVDNVRKANSLIANPLRPGTNLLILNSTNSKENHDALDDLVVAKPSYAFLINKIKKTASTIKAAIKSTLKPGNGTYIVHKGDSIESISKRFNVTGEALREANNLSNDTIVIGKQLIIPKPIKLASKKSKVKHETRPGETVYFVRKGDTIEKIARKFKANPAAIRLANLTDNTTLNAGDKLIIPANSTPS